MPRKKFSNPIWDKEISAKRLSAYRGLRGMRQADLAERADIALSKIRNLEHAVIALDDESCDSLAQALEVTPSVLHGIGFVHDAASRSLAVRALACVSDTLRLEVVSTDAYAGLRARDAVSEALVYEMGRELERIAMGERDTQGHLRWRGETSSPFIAIASSLIWREPSTTLGENLKMIRRRRHVTQKELADRLETNERVVRQWESDTKWPRGETWEVIAEALGVPKEAFVSFSGVADDPVQAAQVLLDISERYSLLPCEVDDGLVICTQTGELEKALDTWASVGLDGRQAFLDTYDDAVGRWPRPTRYTVRQRMRDADGTEHVSYVSSDGVVTQWLPK